MGGMVEMIRPLREPPHADPHIVAGNGGNPEDAVYGHTREQWLEGMQGAGALPNVVCKISGIVARAAPGWSAADRTPAVDHCIDSFGEDRIVFESDWPVCTFGARLGEWITALREIVATRPERLQHKLLHENAERIYQLLTAERPGLPTRRAEGTP